MCEWLGSPSIADSEEQIADSDLALNDIKAYSTGTNPLTLNGSVGFADLDRITLDLQMTANNFELINAKKTSKALAYGKAFVNLNGNLRGTLDNLPEPAMRQFTDFYGSAAPSPASLAIRFAASLKQVKVVRFT